MTNFTLICGSDEFLVRSKTTELMTHLCGEHLEDNPNLEIIHGDADNVKPHESLNALIGAINTPAFFGDAKVIWLKRFDFSQVAKSKNAKSALNALIAILKGELPPDVNLVIDGSGIDRRSALLKLAQKIGKCLYFEKTDVKSRDWEKNVRVKVMEFCRDNRLNIAHDAAAFLAETCGTGSGRVVGELQKLMAYIHPRTNITLDDCRAICSITPEVAAWAFANELARRNEQGALRVLKTMFDNRVKPTSVLGMVSNTFQDMVKIRAASQLLSIPANANQRKLESSIANIPPQLKEKLEGHMIIKAHPFRVWNIFSQSAKFADAKLARILTSLMKVNRQLVSGAADDRIALELLTMEICR